MAYPPPSQMGGCEFEFLQFAVKSFFFFLNYNNIKVHYTDPIPNALSS